MSDHEHKNSVSAIKYHRCILITLSFVSGVLSFGTLFVSCSRYTYPFRYYLRKEFIMIFIIRIPSRSSRTDETSVVILSVPYHYHPHLTYLCYKTKQKNSNIKKKRWQTYSQLRNGHSFASGSFLQTSVEALCIMRLNLKIIIN